MAKSSIIIPAYNQAALTDQCLRALAAPSCEEIVVVDDGSTDHTRGVLQSHSTNIRVVRHAENLGFASACNHGAAAASGQYLVFLNNDTIPTPGWLTALEAYAENNPSASVIGSKLLYPDDTVQHAGVVICQDRYPRHLYAGFPADHPAVTRSRRFQIVTGACMLVRRQAFDEARGFDPAFHNGFEDVDLCLRLGTNGHEIHFCAQSVLHHLESVSPGRFKQDGPNVALYRERWLNRVRPDDLQYYVEDGLLRLIYEGRYPFSLEVSPLLACLDAAGRQSDTEFRLKDLARAYAELARENTHLNVELGKNPAGSERLRYQEVRRRVREAIQENVPAGATFLVVSKGDSSLLDLPERKGWHFPQTERGAYAGYHPESSNEAIAHLESLRARGAGFLVIPQPCFWWLDHYQEFRHHCETYYVRLNGGDDVCVIFGLDSLSPSKVSPCTQQKTH